MLKSLPGDIWESFGASGWGPDGEHAFMEFDYGGVAWRRNVDVHVEDAQQERERKRTARNCAWLPPLSCLLVRYCRIFTSRSSCHLPVCLMRFVTYVVLCSLLGVFLPPRFANLPHSTVKSFLRAIDKSAHCSNIHFVVLRIMHGMLCVICFMFFTISASPGQLLAADTSVHLFVLCVIVQTYRALAKCKCRAGSYGATIVYVHLLSRAR